MPPDQGIHVHSIETSIRWSDMDALGHVNSAVFFTYFEQARIEWWQSLNINNLSFQNAGPVIINATCTYLKPIIYPETLHIKTYVEAPGRTSFECFYEIRAASDKTILYAEGATKIVWVDRQTHKSTPLPEYLLNHLPKN